MVLNKINQVYVLKYTIEDCREKLPSNFSLWYMCSVPVSQCQVNHVLQCFVRKYLTFRNLF